jgi:hypothetical protein
VAVYSICNRYQLFLLVLLLCRPGLYSVQYNKLLINCALVGLLYKNHVLLHTQRTKRECEEEGKGGEKILLIVMRCK